MANLYARLPKVDELLESENIVNLIETNSRTMVLEAIRKTLECIREDIKRGIGEAQLEEMLLGMDSMVSDSLKELQKPKLRRVINGTGVALHTNLGRAPIDIEIIDELARVSCGYSNLEYDVEKGKRGSRYSHLEEIIRRITGAESAIVVNNNAAAVMLILSTIAKGKEVITSRGELIEIGGSFRVPDVCEQSGAKLVEVGTTNKTHLRDYENAINENTAAILKVHTSNYRVLGFTETVTAQELLKVKTENNILVVEDLGSGVLIDLSKYGLEYEPTVRECIQNGIDLVSFSGDKLMGGPQAGIIVGRKDLIEKIKKNPLTRALRVDKFTIAALEATLRNYVDEEVAIKKIPILRILTAGAEELKQKAVELAEALEAVCGEKVQIGTMEVESEVGGGSMPLTKLPSFAVTLSSAHLTAHEIENRLRAPEVPIICRIIKEKVVLDLRTIEHSEFPYIIAGIKSLEG